jgi:hypothetical protein
MRRMSEGGIELGFAACLVTSASGVKMCETPLLGKHRQRKRSLRQVEAMGASRIGRSECTFTQAAGSDLA